MYAIRSYYGYQLNQDIIPCILLFSVNFCYSLNHNGSMQISKSKFWDLVIVTWLLFILINDVMYLNQWLHKLFQFAHIQLACCVAECVITSYSIHYTKLYDTDARTSPSKDSSSFRSSMANSQSIFGFEKISNKSIVPSMIPLSCVLLESVATTSVRFDRLNFSKLSVRFWSRNNFV